MTIEFATHHDDKKADTILNVHVVNRHSADAVDDIAIGLDVLPGKRFADDGPAEGRRDVVTWSATGTDLPLARADIALAEIVLPVVYIVIDAGHDRWIFDYQVTYEFTDPANAGGKRHLFTSRTNGVILDQDNAKHEGVYQGRPFPTVAPPTAPPLSFVAVDHLGPFAKRIPVPYVQRKFDEFVNGRGGPITGENPRLLNIALDTSGDFAEDITPESYADLQSLVPTAGTPANVSAPLSLGQLDYGYYLHGIDGASLALAFDPAAAPTPLTVTLDLETSGGPELISKAHFLPDIDFATFTITVDLTLQVAQSFDVQGAPSTVIDVLGWVADLQAMKFEEFQTQGVPFVVCDGFFLGQHVHETLLGDSAAAIRHFVGQVVHIDLLTDVNPILEGMIRDLVRDKAYALLTTPDRLTGTTVRDSLNGRVTSWMLGGIADDPRNEDGNNCVVEDLHVELADPANGMFEDTIVVSYSGPRRQFVPQPPPGWPAPGEFDPGTLAGIEHIVVLTMENRSFDHVLGYLHLPAEFGGARRDDVDGLTGAETNTFRGGMFPTFPLTGTVFSPDPPHGHAPVMRAINGGAMDGFVGSFAEQHGLSDPGRIMGHHTAATVPQFDALARDFAIGHRWFASHPGPTFCNRFYELTGRLNLDQRGFWEFDNTRPIRPVFTTTIFDRLTGADPVTGKKLRWRYFERGYCFLRFFERYTFDREHIIDIDDPKEGFWEAARSGQLPHVTFIDPHYVELPPGGNSDGAPADVALGQDLVQRVCEAVIAGPAWEKTLLIIVYDEHGGFYDHVQPPAAPAVSPDLAITTLGVRVPALVISPWVDAGSVFGHDGDESSPPLVFDHTSILRTIARRFCSDQPPYFGARYAAANDLSSIISDTPRRPQFLPYLRYQLHHRGPWQLAVDAASALVIADPDGSPAQDFSFEDAGNGYVRLRSHVGNRYVTVINPHSGLVPPSLALDVRYDATGGRDPALQRFRFVSVGISHLTHNHYVVSSEARPDLQVQAAQPEPNSPVILGPPGRPGQSGSPTEWIVTSPLLP